MSPDSLTDSSDKLINKGKRTRPTLTKKVRKILIGGGVILLIVLIALGVGLGVGLTRNNNDGDSSSDDDNSDSGGDDTPSNSTVGPDPAINSTMIWQPSVGTSWQYVLQGGLNSTMPNHTAVWDIDLFENSAATINGLKSHGAHVICYFSAGSYEDWRPDANKFLPADLGKNLDGWPGEKWLNVSSPNVRSIMLSRLDMAKAKGCNGVDPDNVDGYDNNNGLGLTQSQSVDFVKFLANAAHRRGMSAGLKNAGAIIPRVLPWVQWSVNEQCVQYGECNTYSQFIHANKPVFHVEYPKGADTDDNNDVTTDEKTKACTDVDAAHFSTIIKNMDLDLWVETC